MKIEIDNQIIKLAASLLLCNTGELGKHAVLPDPIPESLIADITSVINFSLNRMVKNDNFYYAYDEWDRGRIEPTDNPEALGSCYDPNEVRDINGKTIG